MAGGMGGREGEYGWCTLYIRMNIEFFKLVETTIRRGVIR
jgi:hypothetical protein